MIPITDSMGSTVGLLFYLCVVMSLPVDCHKELVKLRVRFVEGEEKNKEV